ncbi:MAG: preprotein translocase subunit SecE [Alphaproteobacteria bacterium]|nr:preprotein translocase subunit SecE [Alphaproteobacteria bacterium]
MEKINPAKFAQEVRQEAAKVTWPTRKETIVTTGMVFLMVVLAAAFFFVADQMLSFGVRFILGSGA